jgi:predicted house-cleaning noncanonical NTP pyrophosphatase (MazG superfamily)
MIRYNKLVRDRIPEIIRSQGEHCEVRVLDDGEYALRLNEKLHEELREYERSQDVAELVDLIEVVLAIAERQGITWDEFERRRLAKRQERGGFAARLFLDTVADSKEAETPEP